VKRIGYSLTIAGWSVNSADDPRTELVALETLAAIDSPGDVCRAALYAAPKKQAGLLEQAVGMAAGAVDGALGLGGGAGASSPAFSVDVRGEAVSHGDVMTVELKVGDSSAKVMTAEVQALESGFEQMRVTGRTGMQKLASMRINQVYENQNLGQIARDLAEQSGVQTGEIAQGSTYPYYVVHESKNLLRCLREMARREGMDLYFDENNRLTMKKFSKTNPDHIFRHGAELLALELRAHQAPSERVKVYGESTASSQGSDTWYWLVRDDPPARSEAGQGRKSLAAQDGVLRTKDAADSYAAAWLGALKDQALSGRLKILGNPKVKLGDAFSIQDSPRPELNGLFKVVAVRHVLNKRDGFVTWVTFTGQGGAQAAGDLLGGLMGAVGGALGL
jgi:hypothetical protein